MAALERLRRSGACQSPISLPLTLQLESLEDAKWFSELSLVAVMGSFPTHMPVLNVTLQSGKDGAMTVEVDGQRMRARTGLLASQRCALRATLSEHGPKLADGDSHHVQVLEVVAPGFKFEIHSGPGARFSDAAHEQAFQMKHNHLVLKFDEVELPPTAEGLIPKLAGLRSFDARRLQDSAAAAGEAERMQRRMSEAALRVKANPSAPAQEEAPAARATDAGDLAPAPGAYPPKTPGVLAFLRRQAKASGDTNFDVEISRARSAELRKRRVSRVDSAAKPEPAVVTADEVAAWQRLATVRTAALAKAEAAKAADAEHKQGVLSEAIRMAAVARASIDAKAMAQANAEAEAEAKAEAEAEAAVAEAQAKAEAAAREEAAAKAEAEAERVQRQIAGVALRAQAEAEAKAKDAERKQRVLSEAARMAAVQEAAAKLEHAADLQRRREARAAGESAPAYAFPTKSSGLSAFLRRQAKADANTPKPGRQRKANARGGRSAVQP